MILNNYEEYIKIVKSVKEKLKGEYGFILNSSGYVRKYSIIEGKKVDVEGINIDKDIIDKIKGIDERIKEKYNLLDLIVYHNTGFLKVGEKIIDVTIISKHRHEAIEALKELINDIKKFH
ncbi:molybdenum cofactor biosynthesis protein MoaE [Methanocaldococcus sp.]